MAFHLQRPDRAPGLIPESKDTLAHKIEMLQHALCDMDGLKRFSKLLWLYGPQRHEPLPYRYRLEDAPPPPDAAVTSSPSAATLPNRTSHRPISGIIRSDMPPRFRQWFLQDDVIFFQTRSPSYLTNAASACKKEATQRKRYERLWELLQAWIEAGSFDARLSYDKQCALFVLCVLYVFGKLHTISTSSMLYLFTSTVAHLWCMWYIVGLVLIWGPPAYRLTRTRFGGMGVPTDLAADYGCRRKYHPPGYHTWQRDSSVTGETRPAGSLYKNPDPAEMRLLILVKRIQESIRALRSFWDFHRRTTSAAGGEDRYRPVYRPSNMEQANIGGQGAAKTHPIIQRAEMMMMEKGHLVVCLSPYPELVTVGWLKGVNRLYQSYRAWQRWLLAQRVYHELEFDQDKTAGQAMYTSVSGFADAVFGGQEQQRNRSVEGEVENGDKESDVEGAKYSLVVEMSVANVW